MHTRAAKNRMQYSATRGTTTVLFLSQNWLETISKYLISKILSERECLQTHIVLHAYIYACMHSRLHVTPLLKTMATILNLAIMP